MVTISPLAGRVLGLGAIVIAASALAVTAPAQASAAEPKTRRAKLPKGYSEVDGIVAVVGKRIITRTALIRALGQHGRSQQMVPTAAGRPRSDKAMLRQVLEVLIENELVLSAARQLGLTVSDDEIDREIERLKTKNLWDMAELRENVRKLGFAGIREYRDHVRTEKLRVKMLRTKLGSRLRVTEQEVKRVIEVDYKGGKQAEQVRGRHILIKVLPGASPMQVNALRSNRSLTAAARGSSEPPLCPRCEMHPLQLDFAGLAPSVVCAGTPICRYEAFLAEPAGAA